jgi:hypothetical protein
MAEKVPSYAAGLEMQKRTQAVASKLQNEIQKSIEAYRKLLLQSVEVANKVILPNTEMLSGLSASISHLNSLINSSAYPNFANSMRAFSEMSNAVKIASEYIPKPQEDFLRSMVLPAKMFEMSMEVQSMLLTPLVATPYITPQTELEHPDEDDLNRLLKKLDPSLIKRREGAWKTFYSENPDKLSQATNSMVELLKGVRTALGCGEGNELEEFIKEKYKDEKISELVKREYNWIEATAKCISSSQSLLQDIKHHRVSLDEVVVEGLMGTIEFFITMLLF